MKAIKLLIKRQRYLFLKGAYELQKKQIIKKIKETDKELMLLDRVIVNNGFEQ